jgi:AraC family transcriptional regulator
MMEIEAQQASPWASAQLVHYRFPEPPESILRGEDKFRLELCLTSRHRSARACYRDLWNQHRFERIGNIFVVPPTVDMIARSDEDSSLSSIICELDREPVLELFDTIPELNEQMLLSGLDIRDARIHGLMLRVAEELRHPRLAGDLLIDLLVRQIAIELVRHGDALSDRELSGGLASWQLRLIDERLTEVREAPTLPILADLCKISVRQLTRGFRTSRGSSIGAYVANSQMEHAKQLLASDHSITEVAATLGYSSSSTFSFAFRRATGMAPGQFRQTLLRH